jgi:hypothetical protein
MTGKNDDQSRQTQQQSTTSGGSASVQVAGDNNAINLIQQGHDGRVAGVYMPDASGLQGLTLLHSPLPKDLGADIKVVSVHIKAGDAIQPEAMLIAVSVTPWGKKLGLNYYVPSPIAGFVERVYAKVGDRATLERYLIATIRVWDEAR